MRAALVPWLVADGLAEISAFRMRPELQMGDDLVCRKMFRHGLEPVLASPRLAENLPELPALHAEPFLNLGARRTQEGIGGKLLGDGGRQRRLFLLGKLLGLHGAGLKRGVARLDGQREFGVGTGIFVPAIKLRLGWQRNQLL